MKFTQFIDLLSIRLGISAEATRNFLLSFRDELLAELAAGQEVGLPGLGSFRSAVSRRRVCVSNLPGKAGRRPVKSRYRLKFSAYDSGEAQLGELRSKLASGLLTRPKDRRMVMVKKKKKDKKKPGHSIEVSVPPGVTEITIKIEDTGKKAESTSKRKLLG